MEEFLSSEVIGAELVEATKRQIDSSRTCDDNDVAGNEIVTIVEVANDHGTMDLAKREKTECGSVLDDSEVLHEAMGAKVESELKKDETKREIDSYQCICANGAEGVVETGNEENDKTVTEVAKGGTIELAKHEGLECPSVLDDSEVLYDAMSVEVESELEKERVMEVTIGGAAEAIVVARNEENGGTVEEDSSNEARMEVVKDGVMDEKKREEVERSSALDDPSVVLLEQENEAMGVQWGNSNADTEKSVFNEVDENEEMVVEAYLSTGEAKVVEEMDATNHENLEPASIVDDSQGALVDEEEEVLGVEEETANVDTEMETETDTIESGKSLGGKRKRRNSSVIGNLKAIARASSRKTVEEDVCFVQGSVVDTEVNHFDADANAGALKSGVKDKKRKLNKGGSRGSQSNLDDYAAIDVHNISLIYLRRKLMEDLLEETDNFHDKVVGTFVRIRISGSAQKQDVYRLVQVVGTSKAAESYKLGKRTTDILLEILNLNKTEVISIDKLSNQDFTEEIPEKEGIKRFWDFIPASDLANYNEVLVRF